jgi:cellulose synthase/poly-beta-1,6-N-acetylglucosamine synthase-like glycosyltransferase
MDLEAIGLLIIMYFMLYCSILWMLIFFDNKKHVRTDPKPDRFPPISIVIPVYHNDTVDAIKRAVESSLRQNYPKKEIIIAWNGPENAENIALCKEYEKKGIARFVSTPTPGKAAGINKALEIIKNELFCCLDADSYFSADSLNQMVGYFNDPMMGAVTSSMKVYQPKTWLQKIQWVEYIFAIYLRKMMSYLNCLYVIPGPGSIYRTELVRNLGGFDEHNLTEDMEIAFRIQKAGYKIANSANAFVETIAPKDIVPLVKQRIRWYAGFYDNMRLYKEMLVNPKYGSLGMFILPSSIAWLGIILFLLAKAVVDFAVSAQYPIKTLMIVGFDLNLFIKSLYTSIYFEPTYITFFVIIFTLTAVAVVYIGLKVSQEKTDLRKRYQHYALYFITYSFLIGLFWLFALSYVLIRGKTNKNWIKW